MNQDIFERMKDEGRRMKTRSRVWKVVLRR
jgi:hypothetical protein